MNIYYGKKKVPTRGHVIFTEVLYFTKKEERVPYAVVWLPIVQEEHENHIITEKVPEAQILRVPFFTSCAGAALKDDDTDNIDTNKVKAVKTRKVVYNSFSCDGDRINTVHVPVELR